jgi:hypothetical protein
MKVLDKGRLHIAAVCVGVAERMLDDALRYAMERKQFGQPIAEFQLVQAMLADSKAELYAARSMVLDAARLRDDKEDVTTEASCCKLFATEMCGRVADRAVQIHGGAGYMSDYAAERFYRDVRLFRIYEGTSQIQQLVIARNMIKAGRRMIDAAAGGAAGAHRRHRARGMRAATPDAPALQGRRPHAQLRELGNEIDACAAWLRGLGVQAGERVMLVSENCIAQVALLFAASSLDAWIVNVNARLTAPELDGIRSHCGARVVLYTAAVSPEAAAHALRGRRTRLRRRLMAACTTMPACPSRRGAAVAALVYTTGTTGKPKGVMLSHRNLLFVAAVSSRLRGLAPTDLAYGVLPFSHVYGLTSVLLGTLYAGACLRLAPRFTPRGHAGGDPQRTADHRAGRAGHVCAPAGAVRARGLRAPLASRCASPTPAARRSTRPQARGGGLLGVPLHNGYGLTEAAPTVSQTRLDAPRATPRSAMRFPASRCAWSAGRRTGRR